MKFNSITEMKRAGKLADILEEFGFNSACNNQMIFERREGDHSKVTVMVVPLAKSTWLCEAEITVAAFWRSELISRQYRVPSYRKFRGILVRALELLKEPATRQALKFRLRQLGVEFEPTESYGRLQERFRQALPEFTTWEVDYLSALGGWSQYADPVLYREAESWLGKEIKNLKEMEQELLSTGRPEHREMARGFRETIEFLRTFTHAPKFKLNSGEP